ncbi:hypothetical protein GO986_10795 [Deinococcus sp. HMF7620]|uniref:SnoaL-like domain-containing protein n=1 Tax=Deinococcus arboris TaxID=2682977 RepID=A0A7C9LL80_9DEIO|nr:hypothetical protein [Deinococcus arboris]MVN87258.1 hypothetical protein [Deinococcus arboris]
MNPNSRAVITRWHEVVGSGDLAAASEVVAPATVVLGPRGAATLSPAEFTGWIQRSGIRRVPLTWHPVSDRLMAVEQDATWPDSEAPTRVETLFRVTNGRVSAALRLPDLQAALELGAVYRELAATETLT